MKEGFRPRNPAWRGQHRPRPCGGRRMESHRPGRKLRGRDSGRGCQDLPGPRPRLRRLPSPPAPLSHRLLPWPAAALPGARRSANDRQPRQRTEPGPAPLPAALPRYAGSDLRLAGSWGQGRAAMTARSIKAADDGRLKPAPQSVSLIGPAAGLELANGEREGARWAGREREAAGRKMAAAPQAAIRGRGAAGDGPASPGSGWRAGSGGRGLVRRRRQQQQRGRGRGWDWVPAMDRFAWTSGLLELGETLVVQQRGVRLCDGEEKVTGAALRGAWRRGRGKGHGSGPRPRREAGDVTVGGIGRRRAGDEGREGAWAAGGAREGESVFLQGLVGLGCVGRGLERRSGRCGAERGLGRCVPRGGKESGLPTGPVSLSGARRRRLGGSALARPPVCALGLRHPARAGLAAHTSAPPVAVRCSSTAPAVGGALLPSAPYRRTRPSSRRFSAPRWLHALVKSRESTPQV